MLSKIFSDKNETLVFAVFIISLMIFITSLIQPQICDWINLKWIKEMLLSDGIKTIFGGIVSAYILYLFVELKPKYERERKALYVLDKAIASVLEGFFEPNFFQHEKSIRHVKFEIKTSNKKIKEAVQNIRNREVNFLQLKITMQTAHSRYSDFQNLLTLAVNLSPEYALYWLDLTDKIRLLANEMSNQIDNPDMNILYDLKKININSAEMNPTEKFCSDVQLRVLEFFESVVDWINLEETGTAKTTMRGKDE